MVAGGLVGEFLPFFNCGYGYAYWRSLRFAFGGEDGYVPRGKAGTSLHSCRERRVRFEGTV